MIFINIGIDIGGRHTSMGVVDEFGTIVKRKDIYYDNLDFDIQDIFQNINEFINENEEEIETIGIGIPGFSTETTINYTCNLPLNNIDVTDYIDSKLPIYISNDANCATIAEYELIDRKMFSNYIFVTIGTGIGAGIILNGNLYTGSTGVAGEIGHMIIEKDGIECNCGRKGCFEKYASVSALLEMTNLESLAEVFELNEHDVNIQKLVDTYIENVAEGLSNIINIYDPEILVIGGGLAEFGEEFRYKLKSKIIHKIYNKYTYDFHLKIAELKNDAGIIGASMLNKYL